MNYLSHFWLDAHRADAAFTVGGALPDLARLRGTGFRLRPGHLPEGARLSTPQLSLEDGIARHYQIDARWHNHPAFARLDALVRQELDQAGIRLERTSFACHIGAEMILDRRLLLDDPTLADRFYACFTPEVLSEAYALVILKDHLAWIPRLREGVERFVQRRFLADYAGTYLARTWPGIYEHVTHDRSATQYPESTWMAAIERITEAMKQAVDYDELRVL